MQYILKISYVNEAQLLKLSITMTNLPLVRADYFVLALGQMA